MNRITDIHMLALVKGDERYIFVFPDDKRDDALRTFGRFASNPELSMTWYDAACLSNQVMKLDASCKGK